MDGLKFGFCAPIFAGSGGANIRTPLLERVDLRQLEATLIEVDRLGFDSLWAPDHLMLGRNSFVFECLTFLAWASRFTHMRLGTIYLSNVFRDPVLTARMIATLDAISGGRVDFGFESEGQRTESDAYGYESIDTPARTARYEDALQTIKGIWKQENSTADCRSYERDGSVFSLRPVQTPHPPIWISAKPPGHTESGPYADIIAKHADGCRFGFTSVSETKSIMKSVHDAFDSSGRDFTSLNKMFSTQILIADSKSQVRRLQDLITAQNTFSGQYEKWDKLKEKYLVGDANTVAGRIQEYVELGIRNFAFWFMDYPSHDGLQLFANKVMPYFQEN